jgi:hypothetical protein
MILCIVSSLTADESVLHDATHRERRYSTRARLHLGRDWASWRIGKWASVSTLAIRGVRDVLYEVGLVAALIEFGPGQGGLVAQLGRFSCTDGT